MIHSFMHSEPEMTNMCVIYKTVKKLA